MGGRTGDKKGIGLFVFRRRYEGEKERIAIQVLEEEGGSTNFCSRLVDPDRMSSEGDAQDGA